MLAEVVLAVLAVGVRAAELAAGVLEVGVVAGAVA